MGRRINNPSIFQARLVFAPARSSFRNSEHPVENSAFRALAGVLLILASAYIYFVGATVLNVIARKEALARSAQLTTIIGAFEKEYFAVAETITPDAGTGLGLAPVSNEAYVYRLGAVGQAETLHNEI